MSTTTQDRKEEPASPIGVDHVIVETRGSTWCISLVIARHIESCLDREPRPVLIVFVDLAGSRIRIRSQDVESLSESTALQRAEHRELCRGWTRERKADKQWEDG